MELLYFGNGFGGMAGDTQSLANLAVTPSMQSLKIGQLQQKMMPRVVTYGNEMMNMGSF